MSRRLLSDWIKRWIQWPLIAWAACWFMGGISNAAPVPSAPSAAPGASGAGNPLGLNPDEQKAFLEAAVRCADWLTTNQINAPAEDANTGRFIYTYNPKTGQIGYTSNWTTGAAMMSLLMAYHRTGQTAYLEAAKLGADYLKTLQILDARRPEVFGAFREDTPHSRMFYPRDALTGAWGLLWLYAETGEPDYRYRAKIFADWFVENAMVHGWPAWEVRLDRQHVDFTEGNFHGGSAAFFYDFARVTHDPTRMEAGLRSIADYYLTRFLQPDGSVKVTYDPVRKTYLDGLDSEHHQKGYVRMHQFNDDFAMIGLLDAYAYYGDPKYLEGAERFGRWLMSEQRPDGSLGDPPVPPAAATAIIEWLDLYAVTNKPEYKEAAIRAGRKLLGTQNLDATNRKAYGGFYGFTGAYNGRDVKSTLNARTSIYSLIALLRLEGAEQGPYYSCLNREGGIALRKP